MNKIDLIIEALEHSMNEIFCDSQFDKLAEALTAARELRDMKPVAWTGVSGVGERIVCESKIYPFLNTPLYALEQSE